MYTHTYAHTYIHKYISTAKAAEVCKHSKYDAKCSELGSFSCGAWGAEGCNTFSPGCHHQIHHKQIKVNDPVQLIWQTQHHPCQV